MEAGRDGEGRWKEMRMGGWKRAGGMEKEGWGRGGKKRYRGKTGDCE